MRTTPLFGVPFFLFLSACSGIPGLWATYSHPCSGNRTDTLWFDSDGQTGWVGCGSTTSGYGLFYTTNGGRSWSAPTTDPAGYFSGFRVDSVSRSSDGMLYVGGTGSGDRVVQVDTSSSPMKVTPVFSSMGQTWNSFQVGTFRRTSSGLAVAESLTGVDLVWRADDNDDWHNGYGWWGSNDAVQILDMAAVDDQLFGCGSRISQPPYVFLPQADASSSSFAFDPVVLDEHVMGEMWGIDADSSGIVVGGVNQGTSVGVVFTTSGDGRDPGEWTRTDVSSVVTDTDATWIRGVCRRGQHVVAVGEYSRRSEGLLIESQDGGATWSDHTPTGSPTLSRCVILADDTLTVAGANGFFARK